MFMKKSLIVLSILSAFGMQAYAQTSNVNPHKDMPNTTSLDKKIVKEEDRTHESLEKGKITRNQAETLDRNESNIARELSDSKQDGKVTREEKKHLKKELKENKEMRSDMEKSNKN